MDPMGMATTWPEERDHWTWTNCRCISHRTTMDLQDASLEWFPGKSLYSCGLSVATSAEVTTNGGLVRESPDNPLNSGLGIILIFPGSWFRKIFNISQFRHPYLCRYVAFVPVYLILHCSYLFSYIILSLSIFLFLFLFGNCFVPSFLKTFFVLQSILSFTCFSVFSPRLVSLSLPFFLLVSLSLLPSFPLIRFFKHALIMRIFRIRIAAAGPSYKCRNSTGWDEPPKTNPLSFPSYWLFNRDPHNVSL